MEEFFEALEVLRRGDPKELRGFLQNMLSKLTDKIVPPEDEPAKLECVLALREFLACDDEGLLSILKL